MKSVSFSEYIGHWDPNDDPAREHRAIFPQCPFVQGRDVGNIPLPVSETQSSGDEMADDAFPSTSSERPPLSNGSSTVSYDHPPSSSRLSALAVGEDDTGIRPRQPPVKGKLTSDYPPIWVLLYNCFPFQISSTPNILEQCVSQ